MLKSCFAIVLALALFMPTTAASLDAFGLTPYVIGDFAPAWESAPPQAWPILLWGSAENFDGFTAEDATVCEAAAAFWLRTERFEPGQSLWVQVGSIDAPYLDWDGYEGCMWFIVARSMELGIEKVVLVSSPPNFGWTEVPAVHSMLNEFLEYEAAIDEEICEATEDVYCVNVLGPLDSPEYYLPDGIHLSAQGHQIVADEYVIQLPEPSATALLAAGLLALPLLRHASRRRKETQA